jgi:hypothetical protein
VKMATPMMLSTTGAGAWGSMKVPRASGADRLRSDVTSTMPFSRQASPYPMGTARFLVLGASP